MCVDVSLYVCNVDLVGENSFSTHLASERERKCIYKHQHFWHCNC